MNEINMQEKIIYTWKDFDDDINLVTDKINSSLWTPDYIVGVKRGGLIPAIKLSHIFNKPLIMMSCQLRDSNDNEIKLYEVEYLPKNKNILIVDDICDSGSTFTEITNQLINQGFNNIRTCSLIINTSQNFVINYSIREIDRTQNKSWISFPWEA